MSYNAKQKKEEELRKTKTSLKTKEEELKKTTTELEVIVHLNYLNYKSQKINDNNVKSGGDGICVICKQLPYQILFKPCHHVCVCHNCLLTLESSPNAKCPVCRSKISSSSQIFLT